MSTDRPADGSKSMAPRAMGDLTGNGDPSLGADRTDAELDRCRRRLAHLETLFAYVGDAILVLECDGRILDANPAASTLLGYSNEELLTMSPWDFIISASRDEILACNEKLEVGIVSVVQRVCRLKGGQERIVELRRTRNRSFTRDLIVATGRDVTNQQQAQAAIEKALDECKRAEALLEGEKRLLEMVVGGRTLVETFGELC